jgi:hypothetical protein
MFLSEHFSFSLVSFIPPMLHTDLLSQAGTEATFEAAVPVV